MSNDELTYADALRIARGCHDYGGGYHGGKEAEIFHHGISTVVASLEAGAKNGLADYQVRVLHSIGGEEPSS